MIDDKEIPLIKKCAIYSSNVAVGFAILVGCLVWVYKDNRRFKKEQKLRRAKGQGNDSH